MAINRHLKPEIKIPEFKPLQLPFEQMAEALRARQQAYNQSLGAITEFENLTSELAKNLAPGDLDLYEQLLEPYEQKINQLMEETGGDLSQPGTIRRITDVATDFARDTTLGPIGQTLRTGSNYWQAREKILQQESPEWFQRQSLSLLDTRTRTYRDPDTGEIRTSTVPVPKYMDIAAYMRRLAEDAAKNGTLEYSPDMGYVIETKQGVIPFYQYALNMAYNDPTLRENAELYARELRQKGITSANVYPIGFGDVKPLEVVLYNDGSLSEEDIKDHIRSYYISAINDIWAREVEPVEERNMDIVKRALAKLGMTEQEFEQFDKEAINRALITNNDEAVKAILANYLTEASYMNGQTEPLSPEHVVKATASAAAGALDNNLFAVGGGGYTKSPKFKIGPFNVSDDSYVLLKTDSQGNVVSWYHRNEEDAARQWAKHKDYDIDKLKTLGIPDNSATLIKDLLNSITDKTFTPAEGKKEFSLDDIPDSDKAKVTEASAQDVAKSVASLWKSIIDDAEGTEVINKLNPDILPAIYNSLEEAGIKITGNRVKIKEDIKEKKLRPAIELMLSVKDLYEKTSGELSPNTIYSVTPSFASHALNILTGELNRIGGYGGQEYPTSFSAAFFDKPMVIRANVDGEYKVLFQGTLAELRNKIFSNKTTTSSTEDPADINRLKEIYHTMINANLSNSAGANINAVIAPGATAGGLILNLPQVSSSTPISSSTISLSPSINLRDVSIVIPLIPKDFITIHEQWKDLRKNGLKNAEMFDPVFAVDGKIGDTTVPIEYEIVSASLPNKRNSIEISGKKFALITAVRKDSPTMITYSSDDTSEGTLVSVTHKPIETFLVPVEYDSLNRKYRIAQDNTFKAIPYSAFEKNLMEGYESFLAGQFNWNKDLNAIASPDDKELYMLYDALQKSLLMSSLGAE